VLSRQRQEATRQSRNKAVRELLEMALRLVTEGQADA